MGLRQVQRWTGLGELQGSPGTELSTLRGVSSARLHPGGDEGGVQRGKGLSGVTRCAQAGPDAEAPACSARCRDLCGLGCFPVNGMGVSQGDHTCLRCASGRETVSPGHPLASGAGLLAPAGPRASLPPPGCRDRPGSSAGGGQTSTTAVQLAEGTLPGSPQHTWGQLWPVSSWPRQVTPPYGASVLHMEIERQRTNRQPCVCLK